MSNYCTNFSYQKCNYYNLHIHILFLFVNKYLHSVVKRLSKANSSKVTIADFFCHIGPEFLDITYK